MNISILKKIILIAVFLGIVNNSFGQNPILSENAKVSVLTCGTGNESYSLFGHTAIRITDPDHFIDLVYNYGAFDFNTPNFVAKFTKGDLQYYAVAHPFTDFMNEYNYERRSVYEQELNIPYTLKQKLFENLNSSLASGESHYTYKFIDKNCTSMVVDIINKTLDTVAIVKNSDTDITYRTILYPYFDNHFYEKLGTSIIFGRKVDQLGTKIFLPFELHKSLKKVQYNNQLLAKESKTLLEFNEVPPVSWWNNCYSYLLLLVAIVLANRTFTNQLYLLIMGLLGLFFLAVGFYSSHQELGYNYNVLLFNPATLALLYFCFRKNTKWIYALSLFNLAALFIYLLILINKAHLLIVLPLVLTSSIVLVRLLLDNKRLAVSDEKGTKSKE
ncbi:lipoprotein N-acyltransferase Lnb domain-containing protein [Flavobacterium degerlachei]|jgi:hypothetical protein|uniref:Uncharacterized protein n=1 Tax=Flavobacterium degerlachei TaxID=229203 RepID=A0A1H2VZT5_9FLAO|nr:DUF4105 domain-containing protein [Flavobacterium degerlachei]SDW73349.1 protein of unknown function [Flavobacterium degerlachei]